MAVFEDGPLLGTIFEGTLPPVSIDDEIFLDFDRV